MTEKHTYTVELRFFGDHLNPNEVTQYLKLNPLIQNKKNNSLPCWGYNGLGAKDYKDEWLSLEEGLFFLCRNLEPIKGKIIKLSSKFSSVWWCGHFQSGFDGGPTLSPELLKELSDFNVPLFIDNYFSS